MSSAQQLAIRTHRQRLREKGLVRLEVQALEADAPWIRRLAKILRSESAQANEVRRELRHAVEGEQSLGLKALLEAAPLEGIELSRRRDRGRDIDL